MADMTREEAIKELSVEYLGDSEKIIEAKKVAISEMRHIDELEANNKELMNTTLFKDGITNLKIAIKDFQDYIHDNVVDADRYDFVFERIYEDFDKYLG